MPVGPVDARSASRAAAFFAAQVGRSFSLDLNDLSRDTWSLVPGVGDMLADVRTKQARHPHLRALQRRGRGHHALRPRPAAQHLGLSIHPQARGARPVLQRGRTGRLRRPGLRRGCGIRAGARVDAGRHPSPAEGAVLRAVDPDAAARGDPDRGIGAVGPLRPAVVDPCARAELGAPQPACGRGPQRHPHADRALRRPPRVHAPRPRGRAGGRALTLHRVGHPIGRLGASLGVQQPKLLVPPGHRHRLRDGPAPADRAHRLRRRGQRRPRPRQSAARAAGGLQRPGPPRVCVHRPAAGALSVVGDQPLPGGGPDWRSPWRTRRRCPHPPAMDARRSRSTHLPRAACSTAAWKSPWWPTRGR